MSAFVVRPVTAAETRPLRQRILRPQQRVEELVYAHDDDVDTLHVAAFADGSLVGTATVHPEAMPGRSAPGAWRLRGMATVPEMRRVGCGKGLVKACIDHVAARGGLVVWCNARTSASAFYAALGFVAQGGEFELPGIGPHYVMTKRVAGVSRDATSQRAVRGDSPRSELAPLTKLQALPARTRQDGTILPDVNEPNAEREQTDESLRVEREKADHALVRESTLVEETADAVIAKARARADALLAAARARVDRRSAIPGPAVIAQQRGAADAALKAERKDADATLRDERAEQVALLAVERKETDDDLLSERTQADDALATRDEFLALVSHDLRNMLNAMSGYAALIAKIAPNAGQGAEVVVYAQRIERSTGRMSRLIGDLVDIASIEAGVLRVAREVGDPSHILTEAVEALQVQALASELSLSMENVPPMANVSFDPARILQVLTNLLSNAIKFTPARGTIVARVECVGDDLRFSVRDTGVGIAPHKLEAIFERYIQVTEGDRRGVGLGLYISKCIVQGHGGHIWAESKMGEGSTVSFSLPIPPAT